MTLWSLDLGYRRLHLQIPGLAGLAWAFKIRSQAKCFGQGFGLTRALAWPGLAWLFRAWFGLAKQITRRMTIPTGALKQIPTLTTVRTASDA
jgi:hypothetical protein